MLIGIDASRAFLKNRTGIEEYSYQTTKHLMDKLEYHQVFLYIRKNQIIDLDLPKNWKIKTIKWPRFWTQIGLSLEMLLHPVDALFIPAHTVPFIHPKKSIVVVHGLEYEFCPGAYSFWEKFYMRFCIKNSCRWASEIISVSENTKKDLIKLYKVPAEKIDVVYEGYEDNFEFQISNLAYPAYRTGRRQAGFESNQSEKISKIKTLEIQSKFKIQNSKSLLFIGRIEERKNIVNIVKAFEILKEKHHIPHKLILAGRSGYGYDKIKNQISKCKYQNDILELGYISEEEKWELLRSAQTFVFPTLYEGFGIPILEAQSVGCPVVASNNSSIPEVVNICHSERNESDVRKMNEVEESESKSALLTDPRNTNEIAEAINSLISNENLKNAIIQKGLENVKRFSWDKCAAEIAKLLND